MKKMVKIKLPAGTYLVGDPDLFFNEVWMSRFDEAQTIHHFGMSENVRGVLVTTDYSRYAVIPLEMVKGKFEFSKTLPYTPVANELFTSLVDVKLLFDRKKLELSGTLFPHVLSSREPWNNRMHVRKWF